MNQYLFSTRLRFHAIMLALVLPVVTVHAECAPGDHITLLMPVTNHQKCTTHLHQKCTTVSKLCDVIEMG